MEQTVMKTIGMLQDKNIQVGCFYLNSDENGESKSGYIGTIDVEDIIFINCSDGFFFCESTPFTLELKET